MLTPLLPHMHFFHFSDTCYLGSKGSTKFLEGHSSTGSRMLWNWKQSTPLSILIEMD
jgi:hypothetical protein